MHPSQWLFSVGYSSLFTFDPFVAKEEGIHHFNEVELLNPETNIRLGTRYLKQTLDKFDGEPAYAFAAYNAGDSRVTDWQSIGKYHGMDEFVESIPFTGTREYVEAIVRNQDMYRGIDTYAKSAHSVQRASGGEAVQIKAPGTAPIAQVGAGH